jgi:hypothetical protein
MRSILILAVILPIFTSAQINRSAREYAGEQVQEYITKKLFKGLQYKAVSFGELKEHKEKNNQDMAWRIDHKFEIMATDSFSGQREATPRTYLFSFYLDEKMKVLKAETYMTTSLPATP